MFKALVARIFRTGAVPPGSVKQVAGASETKLPAASASPIDSQRTKTPRKIRNASDATAAEPARLLNGSGPPPPAPPLPLVGHPRPGVEPARLVNGTGPRLGQRPGVLPPAIPDRLMDGIMKVLELQKKELDDQQELERVEMESKEQRDRSPYVDVTRHMECLREVTGYTFKEPAFVRGAIFKRGFMFKETAMARDVQLRLALIGDKILELGYLSQNFASTASDVKDKNWRWLSSNATLHYCAQLHNLPRKLAECGYAVRIQGDSDKGFGTLMEAIIGAIYEDSGRDGAATFKAMDKLLGTTMKSHDLDIFAELHRRRVKLPPRQLWWEDLVSVDLQSKRGMKARGTSDEEDPAMARLRSWATDVRRLKTHYGIKKRGIINISLGKFVRAKRGGRRKLKHEQMQQLMEQKKRRKEQQREASIGGTGLSMRAMQKAARQAFRAQRVAERAAERAANVRRRVETA